MERTAREHIESVMDRRVHLTEALPANNGLDDVARTSYTYYMAPYDTQIIIESSSQVITIYLPPVIDAKGKIYSIFLVDRNSKTHVVDDYKDDSEGFVGITLDADDERVLMYSDGFAWWNVCNLGST